ncbi:Isochorismatase-like protein [Schizophyllum amplum]|uniref:nicotinamidase n=1 Tax=Schizophyllum amplum TaxID=97359 RepID=A0A550D015_9AGAR|nr:Isochorismatase-like protein [Auriculariopsis ampla]
MSPPPNFRPALLVIDMQNDFCPGDPASRIPDGALAVAGGRDTIPSINALLSKPAFVYRAATRDWHPQNHVSFAVNHGKKAFVDTTEVVHPDDPSKSYTTRLWPVHCIENTQGAQFVAGLDAFALDTVVDKGRDPRVEMYSALHDPFHISDSGLVDAMREHAVTHVYVVGLAYDYCVKSTALDARAARFDEEPAWEVLVIREGTRAVDQTEESLKAVEDELRASGVWIVGMKDEEVGWLG